MYKVLAIITFILAAVGCGNGSATKPNRSATTSKLYEPPAFREERNGEKTNGSNGYRDGLGFYPINSPGLPRGVVVAANSVFQLRVIAAADDRTIRQIDVTGGKGRVIKEKILAMKTKVGFDDMDKTVIIKEIEFCERSKDIEAKKACPIELDVRESAGFLLGNGHTLWTDAHAVEGNMNFIEKYSQKSKADQIRDKQRLGVFIFDKNGQLLVDPYVDEVHLSISPAPIPIARYGDTFYAEDSDYVALSLAKNIGSPLRAAAKRIAPGDRIFILGFPLCTGCNPSDAIQVEDPLDFADRSPLPTRMEMA